MANYRLRAIAVSPENYEKLKDLGRAGDNMNSIVTKLISVYDKNVVTKTRRSNKVIYEGEKT